MSEVASVFVFSKNTGVTDRTIEFDLDSPLQFPPEYLLKVGIFDITIPYTTVNIENDIPFRIFHTAAWHDFIMPKGIYPSVDHINSYFRAVQEDEGLVSGGKYAFEVLLNNSLQRAVLVFDSTVATIQVDFNPAPPPNPNMAMILGFTNDTTTAFTQATAVGEVTGTYELVLGDELDKGIWVLSDGDILCDSTVGSNRSSRVLLRVPVTQSTQLYNVFYYQMQQPLYFPMRTNQVGTIRLRFTKLADDGTFRDIIFNSGQITATLSFKVGGN